MRGSGIGMPVSLGGVEGADCSLDDGIGAARYCGGTLPITRSRICCCRVGSSLRETPGWGFTDSFSGPFSLSVV